MLRVMRLPLATLKPEMQAGFEALPAFLQSMPVSPEAKSLVASYQIDGAFVNFYAQLQGGVVQVPCDGTGPQFPPEYASLKLNFENRRNTLLNCPVDPNNPAAAFLRTLLQHPQYMVVVDKTEPVLVPFMDFGSAATLAPSVVAAAPVAVAPAVAASSSRAGLFLWSLLVLLLLGGGIFGYLKFLYPWPFVDDKAVLEAQLKQKEDELLDKQLDGLLDKVQLRLDQAYAIQGQREAQGAMNAARLLSSLQAKDRASELIAARAAQEKAQAEAEKAREEAERLAKEEAERKAAEEAERLAKEEAERKAAEEAERLAALKAEEERQAKLKAEEEAKRKAAAQKAEEEKAKQAVATTDKGALPKCETIKKQGKLPVLLLALDGSGSMTVDMSDGQQRIDSAMKAANTVVDRVDKNVDIHMFGIQGCPFARDYGVFKYTEHAQLKRMIAGIDPRRYPNPGQIFTPLVSTIKTIQSSAPANADAVAILISDGLDTCYDEPNFNICNLARDIHAQKPKLKIHLIYMGKQEELKEIQCVATLTKGKVYSPKNTSQLVKNIEQASQTLVKVCQ